MGKFDGVKAAAEMLQFLSQEERERLLQGVADRDAQMAHRIRENLFVFEDWVKAEDSEVQLFLKVAPHHKLVLALRNASVELKEKFFRNLSVRAGKVLKEDLEQQGPQRLSKVKEAQQELIELYQKQKIASKSKKI